MTLSSFARLLILYTDPSDPSDTQSASATTEIWDSALARKPTQALTLDRSMTVTKGAGGYGTRWDPALCKGTGKRQSIKVRNETRRLYLASEGIGYYIQMLFIF